MLQKKLLVFIGLLFHIFSFCFTFDSYGQEKKDQWIEDQLARLTTAQKIGQLIMIPVPQSPREARLLEIFDGPLSQFVLNERKNEIKRLITERGVGGVICFKNSLQSQIELLTDLQETSLNTVGLPLLVGQDAEWGLAMRLYDVVKFPKNMRLGAIQNKVLLELFGRAVGIMCRCAGVHINFAPVVDCNTNPLNPIIRTMHQQ